MTVVAKRSSRSRLSEDVLAPEVEDQLAHTETGVGGDVAGNLLGRPRKGRRSPPAGAVTS
jgi:hypothetical protein